MRSIGQMNTKSGQTIKKIAMLGCLVCFMVVVLLSEIFIIVNADHEHDHNQANGDCAICAQIQKAETLLKQFAAAILAISLGQVGFFAASAAMLFILFSRGKDAPVNLKVRMNS